MKHIYYFLAFIPVIIEMNTILNPVKAHNFWNSLKGIKAEDMKVNNLIIGWSQILYVVWAFIGLLSSQWVLFMLLFAISILPMKRFIVLRWIDSLICLVIILFIIINAYHLKIDVFYVVKSLILN